MSVEDVKGFFTNEKKRIRPLAVRNKASVLRILNESYKKDWKVKFFPFFGKVKIWMLHDENMGRCVFEDGFITPNMPKLRYAIQFSSLGGFRVFRKLNSAMAKFRRMYVFEKRDGFNLLFYEYKGKIIPKTRMLPIASGKCMKVVKDPDFPLKRIERLVKDGYIPYFEVWGTRLEKFRIDCGDIDKRAVQEIEGLPDLNVDMIWLKKRDETPVHPREMMKIAEEYGLNHVKFHGVYNVNADNVIKLMDTAEEKNRGVGRLVTEGYVAHCFLKGEYEMFKIKPYTIMKIDVEKAKKSVPRDVVKREIGKVLLEVDIETIAKNPPEYLRMVLDYIAEEHEVTRKIRKEVSQIFCEVVAREILKSWPNITPEMAGRRGFHRMTIGAIIKIKKLGK